MSPHRLKKATVLFLFLIIGIGFFVLSQNRTVSTPVQSAEYEIIDEPLAVPSVYIGDTIIPVELATSTAAVTKGLSGRVSLDMDGGMLFIFSKPDQYKFWMPDMNFPIDIIWIHDNRIIDIDERVSNNFDPAAPIFYTPNSPAQYVLEVSAGFSKNRHFAIGDTVTFSHIKE